MRLREWADKRVLLERPSSSHPRSARCLTTALARYLGNFLHPLATLEINQRLVADEPEGKADHDPREGRQSRTLRRIPDRGGRDPEKPIRRNLGVHRGVATATRYVDSLMRSGVTLSITKHERRAS